MITNAGCIHSNHIALIGEHSLFYDFQLDCGIFGSREVDLSLVHIAGIGELEGFLSEIPWILGNRSTSAA